MHTRPNARVPHQTSRNRAAARARSGPVQAESSEAKKPRRQRLYPYGLGRDRTRHAGHRSVHSRQLSAAGGAPRGNQLQTAQYPLAQAHSKRGVLARAGPQRDTPSSATASVRSPTPPGQQRAASSKARLSVSAETRVDSERISAGIRPSSGLDAMTSASTPDRRELSRAIGLAPACDRQGASDIRLGGLRDPPDALLVDGHLCGDALVDDALHEVDVVDDQGGGGEGPAEILAVAHRAQLLGRAL